MGFAFVGGESTEKGAERSGGERAVHKPPPVPRAVYRRGSSVVLNDGHGGLRLRSRPRALRELWRPTGVCARIRRRASGSDAPAGDVVSTSASTTWCLPPWSASRAQRWRRRRGAEHAPPCHFVAIATSSSSFRSLASGAPLARAFLTALRALSRHCRTWSVHQKRASACVHV